MGINRADLRKTIYYLRRNGIRKTWYAARERLAERRQPPYVWSPPPGAELDRQRRRWGQEGLQATFSLLVPAYRTQEQHLREMLDSLRCQTYPRWELLLADATEDDSVARIVRAEEDSRVRYLRLEENAGIAGNSNRALCHAAGDYIGLLDHDDILTPDALYEAAARIAQAERQGAELSLLYSDEDKCNGGVFFEPNRKEGFNLDLLLSNNYICHFLIMKRELIQRLRFRPEYDGAQDYDLILRAASELRGQEGQIAHIPKVLYHWRCHSASTAENPGSKLYAYEAGRRAVQDFADREGWRAKAEDTEHLGFYALRYEGSLFDSRPDIGAIGGRLVHRGRTVGGRLAENGEVLYGGLPVCYSGHLHRAGLAQDAAAVDIRNIRVRRECRELFREVTGIPYRALPGTDVFDAALLPENCDFGRASLALCGALREAGYRILYLPDCMRKV